MFLKKVSGQLEVTDCIFVSDLLFAWHVHTALFIFGWARSSLLHVDLLCLQIVGAPLVVVHGLLIAVASPVVQHRLRCAGLSSCGTGAR